MHSMADLAKSHFVNLATRINLTWNETVSHYPMSSNLFIIQFFVSMSCSFSIYIFYVLKNREIEEDFEYQ